MKDLYHHLDSGELTEAVRGLVILAMQELEIDDRDISDTVWALGHTIHNYRAEDAELYAASYMSERGIPL